MKGSLKTATSNVGRVNAQANNLLKNIRIEVCAIKGFFQANKMVVASRTGNDH